MRTIYTLVFCAAFTARCAAVTPAIQAWAESAGVPVEAIEVGDYSTKEVQNLQEALAKLQFPAAEGTVAAILPRPIRPLPVEFYDGLPDLGKKGRFGGNVVVYWLSEAFSLRVATAYYVEGEKHFSREEWAIILSTAESAKFARRIY